MNRYVYIVTRIITNHKYGTPVPNLGVHTSRKEADKHFDGILTERQNRSQPYKLCWDRVVSKHWDWEREIREAYLTNSDNEIEQLRLEKWRIS